MNAEAVGMMMPEDVSSQINRTRSTVPILEEWAISIILRVRMKVEWMIVRLSGSS